MRYDVYYDSSFDVWKVIRKSEDGYWITHSMESAFEIADALNSRGSENG